MKIIKVYDSCLNKEFDIYIGKSAEENWALIDDSSENDIWFHLDDLPSSHVVLKTNNIKIKEFNKATLIKCASLCKENSKYSGQKNIPVIYTLIKNVQKADTVGSVTTSSTKILNL
jgi:predicted ribosome quality control (RQC) complex YloA/Tae2 family protein